MKKILLSWFVAVLAAVGWGRVPAQPEVLEVAQDIVTRESFQGIMAGRTVESVAWVALEDDCGVWAVALSPGGHLILSSSTKYRAMISWGNEAFTIPDRASPQYALLLRAAKRAAAAEAGDGEEHPSWTIRGGVSLLSTSVTLPEDSIVHQPVDTTNWAQTGVMAWYVPGNAPCGCVATATSQIMRALEWPVYAEGFFEADLNYTPSGGTTTTETYAFSPYSKIDYSVMADNLSGYDPHYNNQQVARLVLLNDILAKMNFADGGSGSIGAWASTTPWTTEANCRKLNDSKTSYTAEDIAYIEQSMEDRIPIACTIPGHEIYASGYAFYEDEPYVRINYGWGGSSNGWYHVDDTDEYIIVYPLRTVQCDPLTAVSSATPKISWHLPTCYDDKVNGFTITATEIPESAATNVMWRDTFTELSGAVTGNRQSLSVSSSQLHVSMSGSIDSAGKVVYTWDPIFVPTADSMWTFQHKNYYARGPIHFQVLPLGGVWETVLEIDPGVDVSTNWEYTAIDLAEYAGQPIQLRLFAHPTVYANYCYYVTTFSMADMNVTGLSQVITASTKTFTIEDAMAREHTIPSGALTAGARYAFTVTPNFTDTTVQTYESMPCYTQIADSTTSVESFATMTFSSPSPEAYARSSMVMDQNIYRHCTFSGYSHIRLTTDPSIEHVDLHSSHPTTYPDAAFTVEKYSDGVFDIIIDSNQMPAEPRVNDRLNLSVSALTAKGTRTTRELSLVFTSNETFAVSETLPTPEGVVYPTELYAEVTGGEQTFDSLIWSDITDGTEYTTSEIKWAYVTTANIIVSDGTLVLDGAQTVSGMLQIYPDARVKLTTAEALGNWNVMGSGTLECAGVFPTKRGGLTDAWWMGTVELTGDITLANVNESLEVLGHSGSTLRVTGNVTGYLAIEKTCAIPLELNGSITITDGYTNGWYIFSKLTGSGTFIHNRNLVYPIVFADASEFKGTLTVSQANAQLVIGNKGDAIAGAIVVSADATAVVADEKTWSAPNGVTVEGTLGGSGTVESDLTFASGSTLDATQGMLTVTGAVSAANIPVVVDENSYGRILTAENLAADSFTLTETTALLLVDADGLVCTTRPSLAVRGVETVSSSAANLIAQAASDSEVYNFTLDPTSDHPDGVELFENVISVEQGSDVVKIDYDFGIQSVIVQNLTDGLHIVLAVAVMRDGAAADYADGTQVKVLLNGTELTTAEVLDDSAPGVLKIAVPYSELKKTQAPSDAFIFTVKAVKE